MSEASPNGIHQPDGKFAAGNPGGPGNPHAGQVARLRAVMLEAVTPDEMRSVVGKLIELAKGGDLKAIDLLLTRTLGKADSGPLVAVQMNQHTTESERSPRRVADIVARLRGEACREPISPESMEERRSQLIARITDLQAESALHRERA